MVYPILADLVVIIHLLFIIFVLLGGLLLILRGYLVFVHVPAVIWASLLSFKGWICPLTPLENYLRRTAGAENLVSGYAGGFVEHYLTPLIYPTGLTFNTQITLGIFVLVINIGIYSFVYYKRIAK